MTVHELTRDQLISLKQDYLVRTQERTYWSDLADADEIVPDEFIKEEYEGTEFSPDDF